MPRSPRERQLPAGTRRDRLGAGLDRGRLRSWHDPGAPGPPKCDCDPGSVGPSPAPLKSAHDSLWFWSSAALRVVLVVLMFFHAPLSGFAVVLQTC